MYSYGQIGVALASSSNASFAGNLLKADKSVDSASADRGVRDEAGGHSGGRAAGGEPGRTGERQ